MELENNEQIKPIFEKLKRRLSARGFAVNDLDIYDERSQSGEESVSILEDIDFELELLRNDNINVDYIIKLLRDLDMDSPSFEHDKQRIINIMRETEQLRSKIALIEKFIDERLGNIQHKDVAVEEEFNNFMKTERRKAICKIINDENLDEDKARDIFYNFEFTGRLDNNIIKKAFLDSLKFREKKQKVENIKTKILELFETFDY